MKPLDLFPFSLPNCAPGEVRFEEPRDLREVIVTFAGRSPRRVNLAYLRKQWPACRLEFAPEPMENPFWFGWAPQDDWFNSQWQNAAIRTQAIGPNKIAIAFQGLAREFPEEARHYDVAFRRTLGLRIESADIEPAKIRKIEIYSASAPMRRVLRVRLDAGMRTRAKELWFDAYNARVRAIRPLAGMDIQDQTLILGRGRGRAFEITLDQMRPAHRFCGDGALLTFHLGHETFTIRPDDLDREGPIWFAEEGIFITRAGADPPNPDFEAYRAEPVRYRLAWDHAAYKLTGREAPEHRQTIARRVARQREQTYAGAHYGQPRPHSAAFSLGCKLARQRFWLEANGDLLLHKHHNLELVKGKDTPRFLNKGNARFFFGLEHWADLARFCDPAPVLAYNLHFRRDALLLEQQSFAVPLMDSILKGPQASDDTMVALLRFRFHNTGDELAVADLAIGYSQDSFRATNGFWRGERHDDHRVPLGPREALTARNGRITSLYEGKAVLRGVYETTMKPARRGDDIAFTRPLAPGERCELILKIPYIAIDRPEEFAALARLAFERCHDEVTRFWRAEGRRGSQIHTPVEPLNDLCAAHLAHVEISDMTMPDAPELINTSVGTSTYPNFCNEACMILQELDQRGLHEEVRRRLAVWVKYQGTAPQAGNFTDFEGMFYGAGGYEAGSYNQHHGWVLWTLAEHYLLTGDKKWFASVADALVAGADWIFRQRRNTMQDLPHSRGWERGFLPAGSLEDVTDFFYWLSTNALTWRGAESAAKALARAGHPEAARVRREADAYRRDLLRGFETMRQNAPLVRLGDGRWVPHYPSRLYVRGRDVGWIRETLEGSVYLILSGLYDANSREAGWILDDYQDNRYLRPPYGYHVLDVEENYFHRGGFSMQPALLAGLMPYLDRDEPEIFIWMFFNACAACLREELSATIEHPWPVLGWDNFAHFKTSDEANLVVWLRAMFVHVQGETLYLGRAIPREWLRDGQVIGITKVATAWGEVGVRVRSRAKAGKILMEIDLKPRKDALPGRLIARLRHPDKQPIRAIKVNGRPWPVADAVKGDIELTGLSGKIRIEAAYR